MTEERRTNTTLSFRSRRLGMYLEPADDENRGAALIRFEQVDGGPGEAEASKSLRPGFRIVAINDVHLSYAQFPSIIAALVNSARPVRCVAFALVGLGLRRRHRPSRLDASSDASRARGAAGPVAAL